MVLISPITLESDVSQITARLAAKSKVGHFGTKALIFMDWIILVRRVLPRSHVGSVFSKFFFGILNTSGFLEISLEIKMQVCFKFNFGTSGCFL